MKLNLLLILQAATLAIVSVFRPRPEREEVWNSYAASPRDTGAIGRIAEAAFPQRYLLAAKGAAARSIILCTATTEPLGPCSDTPSIGDRANVNALGASLGTKTMIASKALTAVEGTAVRLGLLNSGQKDPLAKVVSQYTRRFRDAILSNPKNRLSEDESLLPESCIAEASILIAFRLLTRFSTAGARRRSCRYRAPIFPGIRSAIHRCRRYAPGHARRSAPGRPLHPRVE